MSRTVAAEPVEQPPHDGPSSPDAAAEPTSPFQLPLFRAVWTANLCSNFGSLIQSVGASWMMASMGTSPRMVALVQSSSTLPIMLLSLWAGAVADSLDRRRVMLAAQVFMLATSILFAVATLSGQVTPWLLLLFTFLVACGGAIAGPAWQSSVGEMVPRRLLPSAVTYNSMGFNIARSVGPAIGGAIVATAGAAAAFLVNACSYLGLILVLLGWRPEREPARLPRERLASAMAAGVRYAALSPHIRVVLLRSVVFGLSASALPAMMPLVARDGLHGGALTYGLLLGGFGMGAVCGALASRRLRDRLSTEGLVRLAGLMVAAGAAATAIAGTVILTIAALAVAGMGWVLSLSTLNVSVQIASPRWVVARIVALYQMAAFGGMAAGSWVFGAIADGAGFAPALLCAAAALVLAIATGFVMPLPNLGGLDLAPRDGWQEPSTALTIEPRSGPIVIEIEYRLAERDGAPFLRVMAERRRIHRRDGARNWTLLRDLAEPDVWIETFRFPTWLDYVRHNDRRTRADESSNFAMRALLAVGSVPVVRRRVERQTSPVRPGATASDRGDGGDPLA